MFNFLDGWLGFLLSILLIAFVVSINEKLNKILRKVNSLESKQFNPIKAEVTSEVQVPFVQNIAIVEPETVIEANPSQNYSPAITEVHSYVEQTQIKGIAPTPSADAGPDALSRFGTWLKEDWAMKLGAFFLLLAFIWLAEYAIQENWIGPVGRITLGVITGTFVMIFGWSDLRKNFNQGSIFFVLGSGISIATIAVSRFIYPDMLDPLFATMLMFAFSAFVSFVAVSYRNKALAMISVSVMGILPLLLNSTGDLSMLFVYLIAVMLGGISVSWMMNYKSVIVLSQLFIVLYSFQALSNVSERTLILPLIYVFVGTFFTSHILGFIRGKIIERETDITIGILNVALLFGWIIIAGPKEWKSVLLTAWALVFAFGAFTIARIIKNSAPYYVYAGIAGALIAAATTVQFEGPMLAIAFALEAGVIVFSSYKIHKDLVYSSKLSAFFIIPFLLGINAIYSNQWNTGILHTPFFTLLFLSLIPILIGTYFYLEKSMGSPIKEVEKETFRKYTITLLIIGTIYGFIFIWKTLHAAIDTSYLAVLWSLVIYTIIGLIGYFEGLKNRVNVLVVCGTIVLGLVAARLLLIDVWEMAIAGRFLTFLAIGLLFIGSAFYTRKLKRDEPLIRA